VGNEEDMYKQSSVTDLAAGGKEIDHLLYSARTMHVERNIDQILSDRLADEVALIVSRMFQQLLTEVIAEWVRHQVREVAESLAEDHVAVLRHIFLQLLLQVAAPVLIFAQSRNVALKVLKACTSKSVN
jgi:hypothetical protein